MIYLDNAATTFPREEYLKKYEELSKNNFANSSSIHKLGLFSSRLLDSSRATVLDSFKCKNHNVVFTSGSTEGINLGIKGYLLAHLNRGKTIITTVAEHPAVKETVKFMEKFFNFKVIWLPINKKGIISLDDLKNNMDNDVSLVAIMAVNNETGAINDIDGAIKIVKDFPKAKLFVDATQSVGKINLNYNDIDMFAYSGHKIHSLKGSGALVYKKNINFEPVLSGGGHEFGFRSGTVDVALANVLSIATKDAQNSISSLENKIKGIRDDLFEFLSKLDSVHLNSNLDCSPYVINFSLTNKKASVIVEALSNYDIMVSSISACHSKFENYSYVIEEMFHERKFSSNTIRLSFDENTTMEEINIFKEKFTDVINSIR